MKKPPSIAKSLGRQTLHGVGTLAHTLKDSFLANDGPRITVLTILAYLALC